MHMTRWLTANGGVRQANRVIILWLLGTFGEC